MSVPSSVGGLGGSEVPVDAPPPPPPPPPPADEAPLDGTFGDHYDEDLPRNESASVHDPHAAQLADRVREQGLKQFGELLEQTARVVQNGDPAAQKEAIDKLYAVVKRAGLTEGEVMELVQSLKEGPPAEVVPLGQADERAKLREALGTIGDGLLDRLAADPDVRDRALDRQADKLADAVQKDGSLNERREAVREALGRTDPNGPDAEELKQRVDDLLGPGAWDEEVKTFADPAKFAAYVATNGTPAEQKAFIDETLGDASLSNEDRTAILRTCMEGMSGKDLEALLTASDEEAHSKLSAVIAGSERLHQRVAQDVGPEARKAVTDAIVKLDAPKAVTGRALAGILSHMSPEDKNALFDAYQSDGRLKAFLEPLPFPPEMVAQSLLPGLSARNMAAAEAVYHQLAEDAKENEEVADPSKVGMEVTQSTTESHSTSTQTKVSIGGKLGVDIPVIPVKIEASAGREETEGTSSSEGSGQTVRINEDARQRYLRDVRNDKDKRRNTDTVGVIRQHAAQRDETDPGFFKAFQDERARFKL